MKFQEKLSKKYLDTIRKKDWYRHGMYRDTLMFAAELVPYLGKQFFKLEGIHKGIENTAQLGPEFFVTQSEFDAIRTLYDQKIGREKNYLKQYIENYNHDLKSSIQESEKLGKIDTTNVSNAELARLFLRHFENIKYLHHWLWSMEFLNESLSQTIRSLIEKYYPQWTQTQIDEFLMNSIHSSKKQFFQKEQEEILHLTRLNKSALNQLYEKYRWLKMHFIDSYPYTITEYRDKVNDIFSHKKELREKLRERQELTRKASILTRLIRDEHLKEQLLLMQELSWLKTYRIDVYTYVFYLTLNIREEIIRRMQCNLKLFLRHTKHEIVESLRGNQVSLEELNARKIYGIIMVNGQLTMIKGNAVHKIKHAISEETLSNKLKDIKGTIAYKGVVRGKARVLFTSREIKRVKKGDILVCNLTNPDYNPVFKKIAGIVTDEGGILCHSAIMAREFKIPCIIGTKIATRVIRDGDMIEINAHNGTVKIIKQ